MNKRTSAPTLRLRRLSLGVRGLVVVGALVMLGLPPWLLLAEPGLLLANGAEFLGLLPGTLTSAARWRAAAVSLLPVGAALYALWQLWSMFGEYAQGQVFGPAALGRLQRVARGLLALALLQPLTRALMSVALTWDQPPGQRMLVVNLAWSDYVGVLLAAVLVAIARVMLEAGRMAEDNAGFV